MTLARLIEQHRGMFRDDLDFSPSQSRPPVALTFDPHERALVPDTRPLVYFTDGELRGEVEIPDSATHSTQVGRPMSARMLRYLQGPAPDTPWAHGLSMMRAWCRREHRYHRTAEHWRGSLCWSLVYLVVVGKPLGNGPASVLEAGRILQYDNPEPVLRDALDRIELEMDRQREKAERRAAEDAGLGPGAVPRPTIHQRHDQPGLHAQECPQCRAA